MSSFADESSTPDGVESSPVPSPPELQRRNDVNDQISDLTGDDASTAVDDESSQEHCDHSDVKLDTSSKRRSASKRKNVTKRWVRVEEIVWIFYPPPPTNFATDAPPWTNKPSSAYLSMRDLDENMLP